MNLAYRIFSHRDMASLAGTEISCSRRRSHSHHSGGRQRFWCAVFRPALSNHNWSGITFDNVFIGGKKLMSLNDFAHVNEYVNKITFK